MEASNDMHQRLRRRLGSTGKRRIGFGRLLGCLGLVSGALAGGAASCGGSSSGGEGGAGGGVYPGDPCEVEGQTEPCYPGSPATQNMGACHDGTSECSDGRWGACEGFQLPESELCNGVDDDCNGIADDGVCGGGGSGGGSGGGGAGGMGPLLYHRDFASNASSFTATPVSEAWVGANAPSGSRVVAAEGATGGNAGGWLFVLDAEGTFFARQATMWLPPMSTAEIFPGLDADRINSLVVWRPEASSPLTFQFHARSATAQMVAWEYYVTLPAFDVEAHADNPIDVPDETDPASPPHDIVELDWGFVRQTAYLGASHWVMMYMQCGTNAYLFDGGDFSWANLGPPDQSSIWGANSSLGPEPGAVTAAWLEGDELYLLAP